MPTSLIFHRSERPTAGIRSVLTPAGNVVVIVTPVSSMTTVQSPTVVVPRDAGGGAGFMAIVIAMLARGRPGWVLGGALLGGFATSITTALQVAGFNIPTDLVLMLPFATIMLVLTLFGRRAGLPAALGLPYHRGAR